MFEILFSAMVISAAIGLLHAAYIYRMEMRDPENSGGMLSVGRAGYHALWTFLLWLLLGTYALFFWLLSILVYGLYRAAKLLSHPFSSRRVTASGVSVSK